MPGQTTESFHIRLANRFEEIENFTELAHAFLAGMSVSDAVRFNVDFCFEEAFTNIVKYAFPEGGEHWIEVMTAVEHEGIVLRIEDDGTPFDPTAAAVPDLTGPIEERPIGGLGLHLIRTIAAGLEYERSGSRNRLTIHLPLLKE